MKAAISWDKAVGKKVKSSDDKDLGKIQSVTKDYIQTKDGTVSKDYYFIPKYYISGYDSDYIWVSITKDYAKSEFERDKLPDMTKWQTPAYIERRSYVESKYPDFATNIPAHMPLDSIEANSPSEGVSLWDKAIDKKAPSGDGKDV